MLSKSSDLRFEHMISSFHYGQVTGMEAAIRKPLLATCGLDKNIRIWNYVDRTLELYKVCDT
jgi:WD40 repeat protein